MPTITDARHEDTHPICGDLETFLETYPDWWSEPEHPEQTAYECLRIGGDVITVAEARAAFAMEVAFLEASHGR